MFKIKIPLATINEAKRLQAISVMAFKANFEKYGHYPPGIETTDWHQEKIRQGIYHKVMYEDSLVGGIYLSLHPNQEMKIEYLYISPYYQNKKIGLTVMEQVEDQYNEIKKWFLLTPYKDFRNHYFYDKLGYKKVGELKPDENNEFKLFQYEKLTNT
jgi:N-acetylglutamate synthase-like GNAT family acetyltransferase